MGCVTCLSKSTDPESLNPGYEAMAKYLGGQKFFIPQKTFRILSIHESYGKSTVSNLEKKKSLSINN